MRRYSKISYQGGANIAAMVVVLQDLGVLPAAASFFALSPLVQFSIPGPPKFSIICSVSLLS